MVRCSPAIVLCALLLLAAPSRAAQPPEPWLVLSDLHFDPFTQPHLVDRLAAASPDRWRAIFVSSEVTAPAGAGSDTNYALLESTLDGARNAVPDPRVVIVDGDLLASNFRAAFNRSAKEHDDAAYDAFVDKTIAFLAWEIRTAFPRAHLLPAVGETDGYCGDYAATPSGPFFAHMAAAWGASVGASDPNAFVAQFSTGGYYSVPLAVDGARAIVLDDVFWSPKYANTCGDAHADPGGDELRWLQTTQAAIPAGTPVWVIAHLPPGIDVNATLHAPHGTAPVTFLTDRFNEALITALDSGSAVLMSIAGHTHMDSFRVIGPDASTARAPMLVVPAVSPMEGNDPAFTVLEVDPSTAGVVDTQAFIFSKIRDEWMWHREYDFGSDYGHAPIDAADLWNVQNMIFGDERVRRRFEDSYAAGDGTAPITDANWRSYWCANVALTATQYLACAAPQIQTDPETHPSPPSSPSPSPSPTPSPTPKPSP
jgi:sphingomyelin phosphodiesterase acid-like 3